MRYTQLVEYYSKVKREKKAASIPQNEKVVEDAKTILRECLDIMSSRNEKYGSSWQVLSVPAMASLIEMKMNRIATL